MAYQTPDLDSIFQALGDPTRRAVLAKLAAGPSSVSDLAQPFSMALPTFMQHLRKLEDAGLIDTRKDGRVRTCAIVPKALQPARSWLDEQRDTWENRLDQLDDFLNKMDQS
jgi:DNA-binding transcriptional ArsR family regulator